MRYVVHDESGQILRTGYCPPYMLAIQAQVGEGAIEGEADDVTQYVSGGQVVDKPAMPATIDKTALAADGVDFCTISGLPDPCMVFVDDNRNDVYGGLAEITFDTPGTYKIRCEAFPCVPWETEVTAT